MSGFLRNVAAFLRKSDVAGRWRITIRPPGGAAVDVAMLRGAPTTIGGFGWTDPFGPNQLSLTFPAVSIFDKLGRDELAPLVHHADVDVIWDGELPANFPLKQWRWEGYLVSFDHAGQGLTVSAQGALLQVDNYLAKPEYPSRPIPYEWAIKHVFDGKPDLRLASPRIEWPTWWSTRYAAPAAGTPSYLIPTGVTAGDLWSGLLTRSTGSWDQALTGYVQQLLTGWYTARGRFTLDLDPGRAPVLRHRDFRAGGVDDVVLIDPAQPGVEISLSEDWSQSLSVVYGQGNSLSGVAYSGMEVSGDGLSTTYRPLAALRQVHPTSNVNGWLDKSRMRKEVMLQLTDGLDADQAAAIGGAHLARFAEPGWTGTVTLTTDPTLGGETLPRALILAGMTCQLRRAFGDADGPLLHISQVQVDLSTGATTLTVDSKYRDALTVNEVRARGRDALRVPRLLVAGSWQPPIPDQMLPWNYAAGSGMLPKSALRMFKDMPPATPFPWTDWLTQRPPKSSAWKDCYVRIPAASNNADQNWAGTPDKTGVIYGTPIFMAQAGTIRLVQIAAVDRDGNPLPVGFHVSLYYSGGVNVQSMPMIPEALKGKVPPYQAGQHNPFFPNAWEQYNADGTLNSNPATSATETSAPVRLYGSNYERAGYFPGSSGSGDAATGLFVDEATWSFDCTRLGDNVFNPYDLQSNLSNPLAGMIYAMIYCDAQAAQEVFFVGRMFRVEPGTGV